MPAGRWAQGGGAGRGRHTSTIVTVACERSAEARLPSGLRFSTAASDGIPVGHVSGGLGRFGRGQHLQQIEDDMGALDELGPATAAESIRHSGRGQVVTSAISTGSPAHAACRTRARKAGMGANSTSVMR